jgi:flagellar motor switch protein FliG
MPVRPGQKLPSSADELEGVVKAAILLLTLDHATAGKLLKK